MRPPISSPEPTPEPEISPYVVWDDLDECFRLRMESPLKGRLRCEFKACRFKPLNLVFLVPLLPIVLVQLVVTQSMHLTRRVVKFQVFQWGLRITTPEGIREVKWEELKSVDLYNGDVFYVYSRPYVSFTPREGLADTTESERLYTIISRLWQSQGTNWNQVVQEFRPR